MIKRGKGPWPSGNSEVAVKKWFISRVTDGLEESEREPVASLCLDEVTQMSKGARIASDYLFPESVLDRLAVIADEICEGRPVQYILGSAHFMGLDLVVREGVLIPRPETEELVNALIIALGSDFGGDILDIGTGSGCIALSLKKHLSRAALYAIDVCEDALTIAEENARKFNLDVGCSQCDILSETPENYFDVVVSNPPYITHDESSSLEKRVRDFEPSKALFVEKHPLEFYERITEVCLGNTMKKGGVLAFECHKDYAVDVKELIERSNGFERVELIVDLQGVNRHVIAINKLN